MHNIGFNVMNDALVHTSNVNANKILQHNDNNDSTKFEASQICLH